MPKRDLRRPEKQRQSNKQDGFWALRLRHGKKRNNALQKTKQLFNRINAETRQISSYHDGHSDMSRATPPFSHFATYSREWYVVDMEEDGINKMRKTIMCYMDKYFKGYGRKPKLTAFEKFIKKEQWISQT
jgi:hypothetical protein